MAETETAPTPPINWTFTGAFGSGEGRAVANRDPGSERHLSELVNPMGENVGLNADVKPFDTTLGKVTVGANDQYVFYKPTNQYNYDELDVKLEPAAGPLGKTLAWYAAEKDINTTPVASYGAYAETRPYALSPSDALWVGTGFRNGKVYNDIREAYAVAAHKFGEGQEIYGEVGVMGSHPEQFVGGGYTDPKIAVAVRQYFGETNHAQGLTQHDTRTVWTASDQVTPQVSLTSRGTFDQKIGKLQEAMAGISYAFRPDLAFTAELGGYNSPDAPKRGLTFLANAAVVRKF